MTGSTQIGLDFISKLKDTYQIANKTDQERLISELSALVEYSLDKRNSLPKVLDRIGRLILKFFEFKILSIALRSDDGRFRYVTLIGHSREAEEASRKLSYTGEELLDYDKFPCVRIMPTVHFCPTEGFPINEAELTAQHRPTLLQKPREDLDSFLAGDYIDFYMYADGRLIGFIEVSETKDGRLPLRDTVRWIDLIAKISAAIIQPRMRIKEDTAKTG